MFAPSVSDLRRCCEPSRPSFPPFSRFQSKIVPARLLPRRGGPLVVHAPPFRGERVRIDVHALTSPAVVGAPVIRAIGRERTQCARLVLGWSSTRADHRATPTAQLSEGCVASAHALAVLAFEHGDAWRRPGASLGAGGHGWTA